MVCEDDDRNDLAGQGFSDLQMHLWSQAHCVQMLGHLPPDYELKRDEDEEEVEAARRRVRLLLERKMKNPEWKEKDSNMDLGEEMQETEEDYKIKTEFDRRT